MISQLWLIGIGTGSLAHLTLEGQAALREAAVILVPHKGAGKDDLAELRYHLIEDAGAGGKLVPFEYPVRDESLPYAKRVDLWHDEIARRWQTAIGTEVSGPVALLVWGDPSLYDSTLRIAARLQPKPDIRVVPGITAIQALTAAHAIPLNTINGPVTITTGRQLRDTGWPEGAETLVVMLDGQASFQALTGQGLHIWWGAYLGSPAQIIESGPLDSVTARIVQTRAQARETHGWLMDTYLLRKIDSL